jgi:hypothetical protein
VIVAVALLGGGCALNGDFDRVRPGLVTDDIHAWVGRDAVADLGLPPSEFRRLTDDERLLRDLGFALIAPPYDRNRWESVLREYGILREHGLGRPPPGEPVKVERDAYWKHLYADERRSEASAYAQLTTDARNDVVRIEPFFAAAARVADMDRKRVTVLAHVRKVNVAEHDNALYRNNENTAVVAWVCRALNERAAAYGYALERLVIETPSRLAAEAERALAMLGARMGEYCRAGPPGRVVVKD